jgi:hypothetical protein
LSDDIDELEKRRRDVENVRRKLSTTVNSNLYQVNGKVRSCAGEMQRGFLYHNGSNKHTDILDGKEEREINTDNALNSTDDALVSEINEINAKLGELEIKRNNARTQKTNTQSSIREEERRQREENLRRAREALNNN